MAPLGESDGEAEEVHEINVTPFIDVILVLLIIFMVAAPISTVDIPVDLPVSAAKAQPRPDKPVFVSIRSDLSYALGNDPVSATSLGTALDIATRADRQTRLFVRADKAVPYGEIMKVMNLLRGAGYLKIALVGLEQSATPAGSKE